MNTIKEHIKANQYKPVYLLYGTEEFLKKLYQNKLKDGILSGSDEMNYSYFEGKGIDINAVKETADTLPFFSERRLIIIKESGLFKVQNDLADYLRLMPDSSIIVFVEKEIDKRNRLFKAVKEIGVISEMNGMDERNLKLWIASLFQKEKKKLTENTITYLLNKTGTDMELLANEVEKLICFAMDREIITIEDIDEVCTTQITGKIFQMIDMIGSGKQKEALKLYYDLLALREKPMSILYLITRHFNILLQIQELSQQGHPSSVMSQKVGIPPFAVKKYITQTKNFTKKRLIQALQTCVEVEEQVKTGRLIDIMGIELFIVTYSKAAVS